MSRSFWIGTLSALVLLSGLIVFFYFKYIKNKNQHLYAAIPDSAALIIISNNSHEGMSALYETEVWKIFKQNENTADAANNVQLYDSLIQLTAIHNTPVALSMHVVNNKVEWLITAHLPKNIQLIDVVEQINYNNSLKVKQRNYQGALFYDLQDKTNAYRGVFGVMNEYVFFSSTGLLAESSVRKLKYQLTTQTDELIQLQSFEDRNAPFRLYINYRKMPELYRLITKDSEIENPLLPLSHLANWSMLNVSFSKNQYQFKGITLTDDTLSQFLDLFRNQLPVSFDEINRFMPANTAYAIRMGFSDYAKFKNDLDEYHEQLGIYQSLKNKEDSINQLYQIQLMQWVPLIGKQVVLGSYATSNQLESFALIRVNNALAANHFIQSIYNQIRKRSSLDSAQLSFEYKGYTCVQLQIGAFFQHYFGSMFKYFANPHVVMVDDIIYIAPKAVTIQKLIDDYTLQRVLSNETMYKQIISQTGPTTNLGLYVNTVNAYSIPLLIAQPELYSHLNRNDQLYKKYSAFYMQFASSNDREFFTQLTLHIQPDYEEDERLIWQVKLDTSLINEPWFVFNKQKNLYDIMVQDVKHQLYYISHDGALKWKIKMSGRIISPIHTVVYHPSGKWGYLFNTVQKVSLIDPTGTNASGYPIQLPGSASGPLLLTDFYEDSNYKFFIPLENQRVMGYAVSGKAIQGWNPKILNTKIQPVKIFFANNQPYLYSTGLNKQLFVWKPDSSIVSHNLPKGYTHYLSKDEIYLIDTIGKTISVCKLLPDFKTKDCKVILQTDSIQLNYNGHFISANVPGGTTLLYESNGQRIGGPYRATYHYVNKNEPSLLLQYDSLNQSLSVYENFKLTKTFNNKASGPGTIGFLMNDGVRYLAVPNSNHELLLLRLK